MRVLYIFGVIIVFLLVVTSVWFMLSEFVTQVMSTGNAVATSVGSNSQTQQDIDTFFTNVKDWIPILALLGLGAWAFVYAQKKKQFEGYIP